MQLHASLDVFSAVPFSLANQSTGSRIFWLDREVMSNALTQAVKAFGEQQEDGRSRRVREIQEESWDLFLRVFSDGSLVVQAVAVRAASPYLVHRHSESVLNITRVEYRQTSANTIETVHATTYRSICYPNHTRPPIPITKPCIPCYTYPRNFSTTYILPVIPIVFL